MSKQSKLTILVNMDENHIPEEITWKSIENEKTSEKIAKAALLMFWDKAEQNTMSLDLWTKEMSIEEMSKFFFQIYMTMADTFEKATSEDQIALAMRDFGEFFGEKLGVIPPTEKFKGDGEGQD